MFKGRSPSGKLRPAGLSDQPFGRTTGVGSWANEINAVKKKKSENVMNFFMMIISY
jgi:hypothetical protein